jgi:hypothetical protein
MAVQVKWFPTLAKRTKAKQPMQEAPWREGLTPSAILLAEGFDEKDAEAIMPIINGEQAELASPLRDGDELEFLVSIQGG